MMLQALFPMLTAVTGPFSNVNSTCPIVTTPASGCCILVCCYNDEISQPLDAVILKKTERSYGSGTNCRKRSFLPSWYQQFPWIHLCTSNFKTYCFYCKYAASNLQVRVGTRPDPAFSSIGFSNWKKAVVKFKDHEASAAHRDAFTVFQASRGTSVTNLMLTSLEKDQSRRRQSLIKQLAALRYLLHQQSEMTIQVDLISQFCLRVF